MNLYDKYTDIYRVLQAFSLIIQAIVCYQNCMLNLVGSAALWDWITMSDFKTKKERRVHSI